MPDVKSLLPGRAFRSEHAQLRPEPHSIASHGPDPMDPLQTTRMRNGVLYAAEWPCCHDPLRPSLGGRGPTRGGGCRARWRQIVRTKAESQRIVATRPLCRVQYPVPYSSRLQVIHRAGSGNCDRSRLMQYVCAWLPRRGKPQSFRHGFWLRGVQP